MLSWRRPSMTRKRYGRWVLPANPHMADPVFREEPGVVDSVDKFLCNSGPVLIHCIMMHNEHLLLWTNFPACVVTSICGTYVTKVSGIQAPRLCIFI